MHTECFFDAIVFYSYGICKLYISAAVVFRPGQLPAILNLYHSLYLQVNYIRHKMKNKMLICRCKIHIQLCLIMIALMPDRMDIL